MMITHKKFGRKYFSNDLMIENIAPSTLWCPKIWPTQQCSSADYQSVVGFFTITENATTRTFSWLKAPTSTFTLKTLLKEMVSRWEIRMQMQKS